MKIALGTVQFGLPYGIANCSGQTSRKAAARILDRARAAGATLLDTAIGYGEAEVVLGQIGAARAGWQIITKLPRLPVDLAPRDVGPWSRSLVEGALERLDADHLEGVLLHRPDDLIGHCGVALAEAVHDLRRRGLTKATGLSIYGPDDLDRVLADGLSATSIPIDIVQSPTNVLDRRLEISGWARRLSEAGTRLHLRSAFLQGLLLLPPLGLPAHFDHALPDLHRWHDWLAINGVDALAGALRFVLSRDYAECAVLGMDSVHQLEQLLVAAQADCPIAPDELSSTNLNLLDPREWTKP